MKIIKVAYNNNSAYIKDIVCKFSFPSIELPASIVEFYNLDKRLEKRKAKEILNELGTSNVPAISIEDENLELVGAIYSESKPDWELELINKLRKL